MKKIKTEKQNIQNSDTTIHESLNFNDIEEPSSKMWILHRDKDLHEERNFRCDRL